MSISLFCIVSSYAAGFGGGQRGGTFGTSGFGSSYISTYLSYDALSDLCLEVNYNLQHNVYASDGLPSSGNYAATIVSRNDGYYIGVYKDGSYIWFRNPSGGFYIAKFDSDSILSSISSIADSIDSRFSLLLSDNGYLSSIDSRFSLLMADNGYLSSIDSRLSLLMADNGFLRAFLDNFRAIVSRLDTIVDLLSMSSDASAGASVSLSSDALYTNFGTIGQLAQAYQDGTLDPSTTFPTLNAVVVGLLGLAQKIDAVDLNPKVEVVVKEAEYTVNHFTDIIVDSSSDIFNVFYLTDEDGNQTSVGRVAVDSLGASGKLLQFLFRFCVDGALSGVDGNMESLNDFYFDNAESSLGEGVSIWD